MGKLFYFLIFSICIFSEEIIAKSFEAKNQREFDYFSLALQWPGTFCQRIHHCCHQNGCCRSAPLTGFTIHGLWPDYDDGTWPACCSDAEFDMEKLSPILPTLEQYWPTLSCSSISQCDGSKGPFWGHEWGKHGTCSYPVLQDELSFFSKALELYFKYNVTDVLIKSGFMASNAEKYPVGEIIAAVEKAFGATPELVCKSGSVQELRICFTKDFQPRDCLLHSSENDALSRNSCPRRVRLPTYEPLEYEDSTKSNAAASEAEAAQGLARDAINIEMGTWLLF